ncbi:MAG: MerR family transcriptional regulator [Streptococcaceae bacterium]|jgi:DNA-binding transcriptional MerR regulator|nr:MerR family transcriptional regulator [Streptococcaceae bacterium]
MQSSEISKQTGLSVSSLRYYESLGLLEPQYLENGYRDYSQTDVRWVAFLLKAKEAGMTLSEIKTYRALQKQGDVTLKKRIKLLDAQMNRLLAASRKIDAQRAFFSHKKADYEKLLKERDPKNDKKTQ